jgi:hypothetical protein
MSYGDLGGKGATRFGPLFRSVFIDGPDAVQGTCEPGQLVEDGIRMHLLNGKRLRDAYVHKTPFLPKDIVNRTLADMNDKFYLRSTDWRRTRQSAFALFTGLYNETDTGTLPWVPIRSMTAGTDSMTLQGPRCNLTAKSDLFFDALAQTASGSSAMDACKAIDPTGAWESLAHPFSKKSPMSTCVWFLEKAIDTLMERICPTVPLFSA